MADTSSLPGLAEAQAHEAGTVVLFGDDGGQVYLVARANQIRCSESSLQQLLRDIDAIEWPGNSPDMAGIDYGSHSVGDGIPGGMGGGQVTAGTWIHPDLEAQGLDELILRVLSGQRERVGESWIRRESATLLVEGKSLSVAARLWGIEAVADGEAKWGGEVRSGTGDGLVSLGLRSDGSANRASLRVTSGREARCILTRSTRSPWNAFVRGIGLPPFDVDQG